MAVTSLSPSRFSIFRVAGNSLPPRHSAANNRNIILRGNNVGTWGAALFCSTSLFAGQFGNAFYVARSASIRLGNQLGPLCMQMSEIERTKPLHYSLFNLAAWLMMMRLCRTFGIQLDRFRGVHNESIAEALSFRATNRERFIDYAENSARHDRWIEIMEKMLRSEGRLNEIITIDDPNLGLPPVVFVRG